MQLNRLDASHLLHVKMTRRVSMAGRKTIMVLREMRCQRILILPLYLAGSKSSGLPRKSVRHLHSLPHSWRPTKAVRNNGPNNLALERWKLRELAEGWPVYRDTCEWENLESLFAPDAYVFTTWTGYKQLYIWDTVEVVLTWLQQNLLQRLSRSLKGGHG